MRLINVYGPQTVTERKKLWGLIKPMLFTQKLIIFGGDFNNVLCEGDRSYKNYKLQFDEVFLKKAISQASLIDAHMTVNPGVKNFTYMRGDAGSRIDRFYLSELFLLVKEKNLPVCFTDHACIFVSIRFKKFSPRGRGIWRNNASLFSSPEVRKEISNALSDMISLRFMFNSVGEWWDNVKKDLRSILCFHGKLNKKKLQVNHDRARVRLANLFEESNKGKSINYKEILEGKKDLLEIIEQREKSLIFLQKLANSRGGVTH